MQAAKVCTDQPRASGISCCGCPRHALIVCLTAVPGASSVATCGLCGPGSYSNASGAGRPSFLRPHRSLSLSHFDSPPPRLSCSQPIKIFSVTLGFVGFVIVDHSPLSDSSRLEFKIDRCGPWKHSPPFQLDNTILPCVS